MSLRLPIDDKVIQLRSCGPAAWDPHQQLKR
jgi:hypothetical protein